MAAAEGPVTEFSGFANFEDKKRKSNHLMSFPKIVNQMGSFDQKRKKLFFRFCRPIRDIFGFSLSPPFSLIRDFEKQNTHGNVPKISVSLACYRQIGSKSTNHSPLT